MSSKSSSASPSGGLLLLLAALLVVCGQRSAVWAVSVVAEGQQSILSIVDQGISRPASMRDSETMRESGLRKDVSDTSDHAFQQEGAPSDAIPSSSGFLEVEDSIPSSRDGFQKLDAVSAALYEDIVKGLANAPIKEPPRAVLRHPDGRPPVIIFSDTCLVDPDSEESDGQPPCKAATSVTLAQLRKALAKRTKGSKATFLCEYRSVKRYVHCVLQPDHAAVKEEFASLAAARAEASGLRGPIRTLPSASGWKLLDSKLVNETMAYYGEKGKGAGSVKARAYNMAGKKEMSKKHGPCRLSIDGTGKTVIPTLQYGSPHEGDGSTMTIYTACPRSNPKGANAGDGDASSGALISAEDFSLLKQAAAKVLQKYKKASCHCQVLPKPPVAAASNDGKGKKNVDGKKDTVTELTIHKKEGKDATYSLAPAAPVLHCKCAKLGDSSLPANDPLVALKTRVALARRELFGEWKALHHLKTNLSLSVAEAEEELSLLRSFNLAGSVLGGAPRGVGSAGILADATAITAAQSFAPLKPIEDDDFNQDYEARMAQANGGVVALPDGASAAGGNSKTAGGAAGGGKSSIWSSSQTKNKKKKHHAKGKGGKGDDEEDDDEADNAVLVAAQNKLVDKDRLTLHLALQSIRRLSPAHTSLAKAEVAALRAAAGRYIDVSKQLYNVLPPGSAASLSSGPAVASSSSSSSANSTSGGIPGLSQATLNALAHLPPVVRRHTHALLREQARLRRDISLVAARVETLPNTDPLVVSEAIVASSGLMAMLAHSSSSSAAALSSHKSSLRRRRHGSQHDDDDDHNKRLSAVARDAFAATAAKRALRDHQLSGMFLHGPRAGVCEVWPRCTALLGGTSLQTWLVKRVHTETSGTAVPVAPDACADGGHHDGASGHGNGGAAGTKASSNTDLAIVSLAQEVARGTYDTTHPTTTSSKQPAGSEADIDSSKALEESNKLALQTKTDKLELKLKRVTHPSEWKGLIQTLSLRRWCDEGKQHRLIVDTIEMLYQLVKGPRHPPKASVLPSPSVVPSPSASPSPSATPLRLKAFELDKEDDERAMYAESVVHLSGTRVKPPTKAELMDMLNKASNGDDGALQGISADDLQKADADDPSQQQQQQRGNNGGMSKKDGSDSDASFLLGAMSPRFSLEALAGSAATSTSSIASSPRAASKKSSSHSASHSADRAAFLELAAELGLDVDIDINSDADVQADSEEADRREGEGEDDVGEDALRAAEEFLQSTAPVSHRHHEHQRDNEAVSSASHGKQMKQQQVHPKGYSFKSKGHTASSKRGPDDGADSGDGGGGDNQGNNGNDAGAAGDSQGSGSDSSNSGSDASAEDGGNGNSDADPNAPVHLHPLAARLAVVLKHPDAASLLLRMKGSVSCLCLHAGVPARSIKDPLLLNPSARAHHNSKGGSDEASGHDDDAAIIEEFGEGDPEAQVDDEKENTVIDPLKVTITLSREAINKALKRDFPRDISHLQDLQAQQAEELRQLVSPGSSPSSSGSSADHMRFASVPISSRRQHSAVSHQRGGKKSHHLLAARGDGDGDESEAGESKASESKHEGGDNGDGDGEGEGSGKELAAAAPPPRTSSNFFAHIAFNKLHLPPSTDAEVIAFVNARLEEEKRLLAERRAAFGGTLAHALNGKTMATEAELAKLKAEAAQLKAEQKRLESLLKARMLKIKDEVRAELKALKAFEKEVDKKAADVAKQRADYLRNLAAHRKRDLALMEQLDAMLKKLRAMATAAMTANSKDANSLWIAGCQGGGGSTGATLAKKQAAALTRLANAEEALQPAAEDAVDPSSTPTQRKEAVAKLQSLQKQVDSAHAQFLAVSLEFEMATCQCVKRVAGLECKGGLPGLDLGGHQNGTDLSSLDLVMAGNLTGAFKTLDEAHKAREAALKALEGERKRWEEAVVRLARPKSCSQLQAFSAAAVAANPLLLPPQDLSSHNPAAVGGGLAATISATGSPFGLIKSGIYTIFPPDDYQYNGIKVFCDMETDGGGWTLVGIAPKGRLPGPLGVRGGNYDPSDRTHPGNINALWVVQASQEMAISWTGANSPADSKKANGKGGAPSGGISTYGHSVAYRIPEPSSTTLALLPPPPPQPCNGVRSSGDYVRTPVRCLKAVVPKKADDHKQHDQHKAPLLTLLGGGKKGNHTALSHHAAGKNSTALHHLLKAANGTTLAHAGKPKTNKPLAAAKKAKATSASSDQQQQSFLEVEMEDEADSEAEAALEEEEAAVEEVEHEETAEHTEEEEDSIVAAATRSLLELDGATDQGILAPGGAAPSSSRKAPKGAKKHKGPPGAKSTKAAVKAKLAKHPKQAKAAQQEATCPFPKEMYTGTTSLGACQGHAYGVVLKQQGRASTCDVPSLEVDRKKQGKEKATFAVFVSTDETPGCAGVMALDDKAGSTNKGISTLQLPEHMAIWVR